MKQETKNVFKSAAELEPADGCFAASPEQEGKWVKALKARVKEAAAEVYQALGPGFYPPAYKEALAQEFLLRGIPYTQGKALDIIYKGLRVSTAQVDYVVEDTLLVDCSARKGLEPGQRRMMQACYIFSGLTQGILLNFPNKGKTIEAVEVPYTPLKIKAPARPKGKTLKERLAYAADQVHVHLGHYAMDHLDCEAYETALGIELRLQKIPYAWQNLEVTYKGIVVEKRKALVVNGKCLVHLYYEWTPGKNNKRFREEKENLKYNLGLAGLKEGLIFKIPSNTSNVVIYSLTR